MVTVVSETGEEIEPPPPEELSVSYSREKESLETYIRKQVLEHETPTLEEIPEQLIYLPPEKPEEWDYMHTAPVETNAGFQVNSTSTLMEYLVGAPTADDPDDMKGISGDDDEATCAWKEYIHLWNRRSVEAGMEFYFRQIGYTPPEY